MATIVIHQNTQGRLLSHENAVVTSNVMRIDGVQAVTISQRAALRAAGLVAEVRGGDPLRSTFRNPRARRTRTAAYVARIDGQPLTTQDRARATEVLV